MALEDFVIEKLKNSPFYDENTRNFLNTGKVIENGNENNTIEDIDDYIRILVKDYISKRDNKHKYDICTSHIFESSGYDIYSTVVSYVEINNNDIMLETFTIESCCY